MSSISVKLQTLMNRNKQITKTIKLQTSRWPLGDILDLRREIITRGFFSLTLSHREYCPLLRPALSRLIDLWTNIIFYMHVTLDV